MTYSADAVLSKVSDPSVLLSGLQQISIIWYVAIIPHSESPRLWLKCFIAVWVLPVATRDNVTIKNLHFIIRHFHIKCVTYIARQRIYLCFFGNEKLNQP